MRIATQPSDEGVILLVTGKLDAIHAEHFFDIAMTAAENASELVLNAEGIEYLSSAGIREIIRLNKKLSTMDKKFSIVSPSDNFREIFSMTGLESLIQTHKE